MQHNTRMNHHVEYIDITTYWHPNSEAFAGGDALLTALNNGWQVMGEVRCETHWYAGMRSIRIYHFVLERDGEQMKMPVVNNPYVNRLIDRAEFEVVDIA